MMLDALKAINRLALFVCTPIERERMVIATQPASFCIGSSIKNIY